MKEGREGRKETQQRERIREKIVRNWKGGGWGGGEGGMPRAYFCLSCLGRAPAVLQAITGTEADLLHQGNKMDSHHVSTFAIWTETR